MGGAGPASGRLERSMIPPGWATLSRTGCCHWPASFSTRTLRGPEMTQAESPGKVFLVGAGPGDPRLITVRGIECLRRAEVVVHDRLASSDLLREVPASAEQVFVGKGPRQHTMTQDEI